MTLGKVAKQHAISSGYLSQLINKHYRNGFNDFINKLRIENAKAMLLDQTYNRYTINAIALESGFNTKSNFYIAFKKFMEMTPSQFRKNHNKN